MWFITMRCIYKFTQFWLSGMATGCRLGGPGYESQQGQEILSSPQRPDLFWGTSIQLFSGHRGCFLGLKRPGPEVDSLSPSIARVKNEWRSTAAPPICLRNMNRGNLHFLMSYKWRYFIVSTESQLHVSAYIRHHQTVYIHLYIYIYIYITVYIYIYI